MNEFHCWASFQGTEFMIMNALKYELEAERLKNLHLTEMIFQEKIKQKSLNEQISSASQSKDEMYRTICVKDSSAVGIYPPLIRQEKILKYKLKQKRYKQKFHVSRRFQGRSEVAKTKLRVGGKFVKANKT